MRQVSITLLLIFITFAGTILPSFCVVRGSVEYSIPVDYSKINEQETEIKAKEYFFNVTPITAPFTVHINLLYFITKL